MKRIKKIWDKKHRKISNNKFVKNILLLTGGTAFAQILNILVSPIVTRIYSPDEYGVQTIFAAIIAILAVGSLRYELGIPIAENEEDAANVFVLSLIVLVGSVSLIVLTLILFKDVLNLLSDDQYLFEYRFFIPLGIFLIGLFKIISQYVYRERNFKVFTRAKVRQSIFGNSTKVMAGIMSSGPLGLILGTILNQGAGVITLSKILLKKRELIKKISRKKLLWAAKRYIKFPIYQTPNVIIDITSKNLPILAISSLYGSEILGLYGLANTIVKLPMNLLGSSVSNVFYAEGASVGRTKPKRLKDLSRKLLSKLIIMGLIPLFILSLFGPFLFSMVFGEEWLESGIFARIIAFLVFSEFIFAPISRVYEVFEKQNIKFILNCLKVSLILVVFLFINLYELSPYPAVIMYTIIMSMMHFITFIVAQKLINKEVIKKEKNPGM